MKKEEVSSLIGKIDDRYIKEAAEFSSDNEYKTFKINTKSPRRPGRAALAACIALIAIAGFTVAAFAAEAKAYGDAVNFFEENGLSTEGLSRSEVKAVYRDITAKSFTYGKTADVIRHALSGTEILQDEPTPDELAAVWDQSVWYHRVYQNGIRYRIDFQYVYDKVRGFDVLEKCALECYRNDELFWKAEFADFYISNYSRTKNGTVVWGTNETFSSGDTSYGWVALVNDDGNVIWQSRLEHGFNYENVGSVLDDGDGTWAVISRGDGKFLCLARLDSAGKEQSFRKTEVGNLGIWNAAKFGDGYIVQLGNSTTRDNALIYKMDSEGNLIGTYSYEADDCEYYLTDMIGFEGQIYLSAYAVPMQNDEGGRHEIANVLDYVFKERNFDISSEELTPLVRDNYTAVLLICDPEGGAPKTFYSVKGSLGGKLSESDSGQLEWEAESITSTFFSPATSSFTVGGTCKVFRYTFDKSGKLMAQTDTGDTVPYAR